MNMLSRLRQIICIVMFFTTAAVLRAQDSGWSVNERNYQYDMTAYAELKLNGTVVDYSNYEVGAFVGDECRAVAEVMSQDGYTWLYLRIRSNNASGETVTLKAYDKIEKKTYTIIETIPFTSNGQVGMPSSPTTLTLKTYTLGDVNDDGEIDVSDVQELIDLVLSSDDLTFNPAYDFNEDGEIDVSDIQSLIDYILNQ